MLELTLDNYYSQQANEEYMSVSQYKDFELCEVYALAKLRGEYVEEKSKALLVGSYVDSYFSNRLDMFVEENPQVFKKDGTLLKDFEKANECINAITSDDFFSNHIKGKTQVIVKGVIGGVWWKGAIDFLNTRIVDLKCVASIRELVWKFNPDTKRNYQTNFINANGYITQGAVYQELTRQMLNEKLPFDIAAVSKEEIPDKAIINIDDDLLANELQEITKKVVRYDLIKKGVVEPIGCGNCPVCRQRNKLNRVISYSELFGERYNENEEE